MILAMKWMSTCLLYSLKYFFYQYHNIEIRKLWSSVEVNYFTTFNALVMRKPETTWKTAGSVLVSSEHHAAGWFNRNVSEGTKCFEKMKQKL